MSQVNFATSLEVKSSPADVFKAVINPRAWWSEEILGTTDKLNAEWSYQFGDNHRCKMKVIEMVPNKKVVWLVEDNYFKNAKDQTEWVGNQLVFEINHHGETTQLTFTQLGLVPSYTCYKSCEWAWTGFIQKSLQSLITSGRGQLHWYK